MYIITTLGGDPDGAYRISRCLQHYYRHVRLVIPSFCKSAGTLIAIIADELAIGDLGELGPLDIQLRKNTETNFGPEFIVDLLTQENGEKNGTQSTQIPDEN